MSFNANIYKKRDLLIENNYLADLLYLHGKKTIFC